MKQLKQDSTSGFEDGGLGLEPKIEALEENARRLVFPYRYAESGAL